MKTALLLAASALLVQTLAPSARQLLNLARPLTGIEIQTVLDASRQALTARTLRLSSVSRGPGPEVLMGPAGLPRIVRTTHGMVGGVVGGVVSGRTRRATRVTEQRWREEITRIVDYTGLPGRRCDGSADAGELVIEYEHRSSTNTWTATARIRSAGDVGGPGIGPMFELLAGVAPIRSGERREIGDRPARAFVSPRTPPPYAPADAPLLIGDPRPNVTGEPAPGDATQSLWIDTASLLPLRWEVSDRGMRLHGFDVVYESIDLRPPAGVAAPRCVG